MKQTAITITPAPNGWIVARRSEEGFYPETLAVFNRMEDLKRELPKLLGVAVEESKPEPWP